MTEQGYGMQKITSATNVAKSTAFESYPVTYDEDRITGSRKGAASLKGTTTDEEDLARFGKRQQFKRRFGITSTIGLGCTLMVTWESILQVFQVGLLNGGGTGLVAGYFFTWAGTMCQALVVCELASMIPLAGGQYNWVAILAPRSVSKFLSYITGWMSVISWQAATASGTLLCGTMIQAMAVLNAPDYVPQRWQATLIFYGIIGVATFVNTYLARILPKLEALILILHIVGFFGIIIPLLYLAPHAAAKDVFQFNNGGVWETNGLSFFVGCVATMFVFLGIDGATHMAEEIEAAPVVIPRALITTVLLNGSLGLAMLLAILFCLGDADTVLSTPTGLPFLELLYQTTGSKGGATGMVVIVLLISIFSTFGLLATTSRMLWAFARERGVPGSGYLAKVEPRTCLPLWSIAVTVAINLAFGLINIGSTTAFNALTGLTVAAFYGSFSIAAAVLLHRRLTTPKSATYWGPFQLGRLGVPIITVAICYSLTGAFFSFWPPASAVTVQSMNWSAVVFVGFLAICLVHWQFYARKTYTGPIIEVHGD